VSEEGVERKLTTILAADVVGYSRLMGEDEAGTLARLKSLRKDLVQPKINGCRGRTVKLTGDGLLAEFPSVVEAVRCAIDIQQDMAGREVDLPDDQRLRLRIGVNLGDIIVEGSDIYGDGVNVAARLESLAEPGGICISGKVYGEVRNKLPAAFEDLGEREVKNIREPVRVYRWTNDDAESTPGTEEAEDALPLLDKPSIAVLPFDNMSGDPEQEYFADGITEDIITELSRNRWMAVIARNTTFTYKGAAVNVADVARELGVRYVIEGSVRKSSDRVRISVQLIEGLTGNHVWAERYDRQVIDIFDLQDEITRSVAAAIEPEIFAVEGHNASQRNAADLSAWDDMMRARAHFWRMTSADSGEAIKRLSDVLGRHPDNSLAHSMLAFMYLFSVHMGWLPPDPYRATAASLARKAISLDEQDSWAHIALGYLKMMERDTDAAISELTRALNLNPNSATAFGYRAYAKAFGARTEDALEDVEQTFRLSPRDPQVPYFNGAKAVALFLGGNLEEAVGVVNRVLDMRPELVGAFRLKCSALAHLGRFEEAQEALARVLELQPDISLAALEQAQPYATQRRKECATSWRA
jgi:adenylate cyclase